MAPLAGSSTYHPSGAATHQPGYRTFRPAAAPPGGAPNAPTKFSSAPNPQSGSLGAGTPAREEKMFHQVLSRAAWAPREALPLLAKGRVPWPTSRFVHRLWCGPACSRSWLVSAAVGGGSASFARRFGPPPSVGGADGCEKGSHLQGLVLCLAAQRSLTPAALLEAVSNRCAQSRHACKRAAVLSLLQKCTHLRGACPCSGWCPCRWKTRTRAPTHPASNRG